MPKILESKLKREAKKKGLGKKRSNAYVYGTLNKLGIMKGNKETTKGKKTERLMLHQKLARGMNVGAKKKMSNRRG